MIIIMILVAMPTTGRLHGRALGGSADDGARPVLRDPQRARPGDGLHHTTTTTNNNNDNTNNNNNNDNPTTNNMIMSY